MPTCPICETNVRDDENAAVMGEGFTLVHPTCITPELGTIALEFARGCYSGVEEETDYGRKYMPAQRIVSPDVMADCWDTPNLTDYTVVQLGMLADLQNKADEDYWTHDEALAEHWEREEEALIIRTIDMGAGDRETAMRWLDAA